MPELKFVISDPKTGKSYAKKHVADLSGRKIGEKFSGNELGLSGYEFEITGGSDDAGFAMRQDINISGRKSALLGKGAGVNSKRKGEKLRKTVRGGIFGEKSAQVNLKITNYGKEDIMKALGIEEKPKEEKKAEEEKEKVEEKPKVEEKKEEVKEDKVDVKEEKPEVKEEVKTEEKKE